jgi:hypothetical protein
MSGKVDGAEEGSDTPPPASTGPTAMTKDFRDLLPFRSDTLAVSGLLGLFWRRVHLSSMS